MTEKRFTIDDECDIIEFDYNTNKYIQDFMWADGKSWDRICNRLNELFDENEQLKHNNKMLSMKMSEVSTKYRLLKEFSEDTDPNESVKTVLHELMMITKEYR